MFADVAVPVAVRQTFTYRLSGDMASRAQLGCRVLVPFGKKLLTAFIVDLNENPQTEVEESDIKDVEELLDETPIITAEILELTRWVSDYYFAPWGECLRAALPAGATSISEQVISLTGAGRRALSDGRIAPSKLEVLRILSGSDFVTAKQIERNLSRSRAGDLIRQLAREGLITVSQRIADTQLKPRLQNVVRLKTEFEASTPRQSITNSNSKSRHKRKSEAGTADRALNEKQLRVVKTLNSESDGMPFND